MTTSTLSNTAERLSLLDSVGLDDLNENASLLTRTDRKYVMPEARAEDLLDALGDSVRALEIGGRREFGYHSTYFDTPERLSYTLAAYGRRRRFKVRTRVYTDTAECWLEVKTRGPRGITVKRRLAYRHDSLQVLTAEGAAFVQECLAAAAIPWVDVSLLSPALTTDYRRSTLLLPGIGARVTLDRDLSWSLPQGPVLGASHVVVVETKSGSGGSSEVDRRLWRLGQRPMRFSKFGTGLALFHPHLSANKWQRVVRRHLEDLTIPSDDRETLR